MDEQTKVPDVCQSTKLIEPFRELGRDCCTELDAYSRWLGRNPEGAGFKCTALLPAPLLAKADNPQLQSLRDRLEQLSSNEEPWLIEGAELIDLWSPGVGQAAEEGGSDGRSAARKARVRHRA